VNIGQSGREKGRGKKEEEKRDEEEENLAHCVSGEICMIIR